MRSSRSLAAFVGLALLLAGMGGAWAASIADERHAQQPGLVGDAAASTMHDASQVGVADHGISDTSRPQHNAPVPESALIGLSLLAALGTLRWYRRRRQME